MKQKANDWLLRLIRIDSCGNRESSHVRLYAMTKAQVMELVEFITKIAQYSSSSEEKFRIEHIDSVSHLHDMNE